MLMIPTFILSLWGQGLFSIAILAGAAYAGREWYRRSWVYDPRLDAYVFHFEPGFNDETAALVIALIPGWRATAHRPAQVLRSE